MPVQSREGRMFRAPRVFVTECRMCEAVVVRDSNDRVALCDDCLGEIGGGG